MASLKIYALPPPPNRPHSTFLMASPKSIYSISAFSILPRMNTIDMLQPHQEALKPFHIVHAATYGNTLIVYLLQQLLRTIS